mmetsp:Transcript_37215/g.54539  ORF Transcript_37215/g.54539 Transcript_37215/m.54539 type:complete len:210 (+) Transcript_37215:103-732(+)
MMRIVSRFSRPSPSQSSFMAKNNVKNMEAARKKRQEASGKPKVSYIMLSKDAIMLFKKEGVMGAAASRSFASVRNSRLRGWFSSASLWLYSSSEISSISKSGGTDWLLPTTPTGFSSNRTSPSGPGSPSSAAACSGNDCSLGMAVCSSTSIVASGPGAKFSAAWASSMSIVMDSPFWLIAALFSACSARDSPTTRKDKIKSNASLKTGR